MNGSNYLQEFYNDFWKQYPISEFVRVDGNVLSWILSNPDDFARLFKQEVKL